MARYEAQCSRVGSFSYATNFKLYLDLNEVNTNIGNNTSQVQYNCYCQSSGSGSINATHFKYLNINGQDIINTTQNVNVKSPNAYIGIASGTTGDIGHNADGSKTISFTAEIRASSYGVSARISGTFTLSTIPRYASITRFDLSRRNETSVNFTWEASKSCDAVQYSVNNGGWQNGVYPITTINGLNPNTAYNIKIRVKATDSQLWTESSNKSITTNPAPAQTFISKTETSIDMKWSCDSDVDYIWYSQDNGTSWTGLDVTDGTSGSYSIDSLTANTTYNIKTRIRRKSLQTVYETPVLNIDTYDYPKCTETPNFTIGDSITIKLYNPLKRNVTIKGYGNNKEIFSGSTDGTEISGFNDTSSVTSQYESIPNQTSNNYKVVVTYGSINKTTENGNTYSIKGTETPAFNNFEYKDTNTTVTNITGNNQVLVKGLSNLQVSISSGNKMTGQNGAGSKSYTATIDSINKTVDYSTNNINIDIGKINSSGSKRLDLTAYDTRGLSKTIFKDIMIYDYNKAIINATVSRLNNFENQTTLKVAGEYTRLNINNVDKNIITKVQYRYRASNGSWSNWSNISFTAEEGKYTCNDVIVSLDNTKAFEFEIQTIDKLETNTAYANVAIGQAIFFISSNKKACYINGQEILTYDVVDTW